MKPLKPSHRERKRYLLVSGKDVSQSAIEKALFNFVGVLGFAQIRPQFLGNRGKKVIIAINRDLLDIVRASFVLSGKDIHIEKVSGSVKNVKA